MKTIRLTEQKLNSIVNQCIRQVINEGYSSKNRQDEIIAIAKEIYNAMIMNKNYSYDTELATKIDNKSSYLTDIHAEIGEKENAYANNKGIVLKITHETTLNTIAKLLMHEFTHEFDIRKERETKFNGGVNIYRNVNYLGDMPQGVSDIIYHLWIPTEFNAFQTTYDFKHKDFNDMFETFMGYIEEANRIPADNSSWEDVRYCLSKNIPERYKKCSKEAFKKFFINNSLALMKKLVKKWDGNQNTKFA